MVERQPGYGRAVAAGLKCACNHAAVGNQVAVAEHHAFGFAGRTRRVKNRSQVFFARLTLAIIIIEIEVVELLEEKGR